MTDRTFLLQDWVTVRGTNATAAALVQSQEAWLDITGFADGAFWIDVAEVTPPGSSSSNWLQLFLETAPTCDDISTSTIAQSWFQPTTGDLKIGTATQFIQASASPFVVRSARAVSAVSLSRYLRWRIVPNTTGAWDLTFRIRVVANRSGPFVPTDIAGCVLWVRSDLGVGLSGANVTAWADESGSGHDTVAGVSPTYSQNAINGLPAPLSNGTTQYMVTSSSVTLGANASIFTVVQPTAAQASYARIVEQLFSASYYLGVDTSGTVYKFIVNSSVSPFGTASGGTVMANATTLVSGVYSSATTVGTLYVNGASVGSSSFTAPGATARVIDIMGPAAGTGGAFWKGYCGEVIIYNRALTAAEITRVHRYLGGRYGVAVP